MATERLYYTDCYLSTFTANVVETAEEGRRVYLDRTAFYPSSGGQPNDWGMFAGRRVVDVIDEDERIAHVVESPVEKTTVEGQIDWPRRYDHMQQHTGQHLLSAALVELFQIPTLSFHMGTEVSTIELGASEWTPRHLDSVEERVNEIVGEARAVRILFEDAEVVQDLRKPSARTGTLRIIEIDRLDRSACGGTHVRSTAELGPIQIRKSEKIRGHVRIEFVCGLRAQRRARQDFRVLSELARQGAAQIDRLPEQISSLRERLSEAEKERQRTSMELARRDGEALYEAAAPSADGTRRLLLRETSLDEAVRAKAQAFANGSKAVALVLETGGHAMLVAVSADSGIHAGAVLRETLTGAGGRGGGSAMLAQGSLPNDDVAGQLKRALGFS